MQEYTFSQIIVAAFGALLGGGLSVKLLDIGWSAFKDARERRKVERQQQITGAAEFRRLELEEDEATAARWQRIVDYKDAEIAKLEKKLKECEESTTFSRPKVTLIYRALAALEEEARQLRVAECPPEVVYVLNTKIGKFEKSISDLRDLLP